MPRRPRTSTAPTRTHKTSFSLPLAADVVLAELTARARRESGVFVEKAAILRALLAALGKVAHRVDLANLEDEDDLAERIERALRRR